MGGTFNQNRAPAGHHAGQLAVPCDSHDALDQDKAIQEDVRDATRTLLEAVVERRAGRMVGAGSKLERLQQK